FGQPRMESVLAVARYIDDEVFRSQHGSDPAAQVFVIFDGVSVLKGWREGDRNLPVLVMKARDGWPDKVSSFKAGADDFLAKPFKVEELVLRLREL
ncbi:response regulator, partial [Rhizobium johnstonii]